MSGSYVVLARKYRPQTFEEVVGQNAVSQTLLNAVEAGRVAHAYVFSGPRGVGKTTTARILAKCLNCEKGPTKTPCNKCSACVSISQSNSTDDVLEIDGASNRGIEQIRELRESAKYAPAHSRYRIYIIDEAHQITKDAFGALLKTLEEPPPHVVFMMATTEVQKIPAPILSRCQRFSLRPISAEHVLKHLKSICQQEKIKVADEALSDVVRFVEGSLRDALSLLDQAIVFAPNGITSNTIRDLLGLLPMEMIQNFASTVAAGEPAAILRAANEAVQNGIDLMQLAKDLQSYYHNLLLSKAGVEDAFKVNSKTLKEAAAAFDFQTLERNIRLLSRALEDMRHSETPRAIFEIAALRLGQKTVDAKILLERLEKLEKAPARALSLQGEGAQRSSLERSWAGEGKKEVAPAGAPHPTAFGDRPLPEGRGEKVSASLPATTPSTPVPAPVTSSSGVSAQIALGSWSSFISDVATVKASLASALEQAIVADDGGRLLLRFDKVFNHDMVNRSMDTLKDLFTKRFGAWIPMDLKIEKTAMPASPPPAVTARPAPSPTLAVNVASSDNFEEVKPTETSAGVQKALKHFPGTVKREKKS